MYFKGNARCSAQIFVFIIPVNTTTSLCPLCSVDTPSQRVQFILGTEDDDLEHVPHDLFTELDELSFRDGSAIEWKETARSGQHFVTFQDLYTVKDLYNCNSHGTVISQYVSCTCG